jgi:hypothetical protein
MMKADGEGYMAFLERMIKWRFQSKKV